MVIFTNLAETIKPDKKLSENTDIFLTDLPGLYFFMLFLRLPDKILSILLQKTTE